MAMTQLGAKGCGMELFSVINKKNKWDMIGICLLLYWVDIYVNTKGVVFSAFSVYFVFPIAVGLRRS